MVSFYGGLEVKNDDIDPGYLLVENNATVNVDLTVKNDTVIERDLSVLRNLTTVNLDTDSIVYKNLSVFKETITSITDGSYTLTNLSSSVQYIIGAGVNFSVILPNSGTQIDGARYTIINTTPSDIFLYYNDGTTLLETIISGSKGELYLRTAGTQNGIWDYRSVDPTTRIAIDAQEKADNQIDINNVSKEPTGFENRTDSVSSFVNATRTFSISPVSSSFNYWVRGVKYISEGTSSVIIQDVEGIHFIYFDDSVLVDDPAPANVHILEDVAYTAVLYWNVTNQEAIYIGEERHGLTMDGKTHAYLHATQGSRYDNGFGLGNFTIGDGSLNSHSQFDVSNGKFWDEDLDINISNNSPQVISPILEVPIYYKIGTINWRIKYSSVFPMIISGEAGYTGVNGLPAYNMNTNGTYSLEEIPSGKFFNIYYFATNDVSNPIIGVLGIQYYDLSNDARENIGTELGNIVGLPFAEFVSIGCVIFQADTSYTNGSKSRIVSTESGNYIDLRDTSVLKIGSAANYHGSLGGLSEDHHQQYLLIDGTRPMTGDLDMSLNRVKDATQIISTPLSIVTSLNGVYNLLFTTNSILYLTGTSTGFSIVLPNSTSMLIGTYFEIYNNNSESVLIKYNNGDTILSVKSNSIAKIILQINGTQNGVWSIWSLETGQAAGIINENIVSSVIFSTTSTIDIPITSFTITPPSGQYAIWFSSSCENNGNNRLSYCSLYKNTVQIPGTEKVAQSVSSSFVFMLSTQGIENFNGNDELRVYVRTTGSLNVGDRSLIMIRLGGN